MVARSSEVAVRDHQPSWLRAAEELANEPEANGLAAYHHRARNPVHGEERPRDIVILLAISRSLGRVLVHISIGVLQPLVADQGAAASSVTVEGDSTVADTDEGDEVAPPRRGSATLRIMRARSTRPASRRGLESHPSGCPTLHQIGRNSRGAAVALVYYEPSLFSRVRWRRG